jgi:hypothetical protein
LRQLKYYLNFLKFIRVHLEAERTSKKLKSMKVLVDIPDKEAVFGMKVLKSLSFVKNAKPMSLASAELWENLKEAAEEVRLHKQGKIQLKTAQELLDEL